ncbi:MAG: sulfur carrier protein ThiS [bacterium]|nr:sulfur carrier protein ThiS [bacterium]
MQTTEESLSILSLLEQFDLQGRRVAVAVNDEIVPRSRYCEVKLSPGDRVEVIQAVGGG